jgi:hypothetical protein
MLTTGRRLTRWWNNEQCCLYREIRKVLRLRGDWWRWEGLACLIGRNKTDHAQGFAKSHVIGEKTALKIWWRFILI